MKNIINLLFFFTVANTIGCKPIQKVEIVTGKITSPQFIDELLIVSTDNYKISTNEPATFSSADSRIIISSDGVVKRITSGEVVPIDIVYTKTPDLKTRVFALGATDTNYDQPNKSFNGVPGTDIYNSYMMGWASLHQLHDKKENYAIILRHADASIGKDFTRTTGPANWWTSCESADARQLDAQGKQRAAELGRIYKDLNLPIARVITSEFCRANSTAVLMQLNLPITLAPAINHPSHNNVELFKSMMGIVKEQPLDGKITLLVAHHPINEVRRSIAPSFPDIIPFPWTSSYLVKISADKTLTYLGAMSYPMMKYYRDLKLNRLPL